MKIIDLYIVDIKKALIKSCLEGDAKLFSPYLKSPKVKVVDRWENKLMYYHYFDHMLKSVHRNNTNKLFLKVETPVWEKDKDVVYYEFYDSIHKQSRLSILVKEDGDSITIDVLPF